jgi:hypothetical protein
MIKLSVPFLLTNDKQLPKKLIKKYDLWLEANVFDSNQLISLVEKNKFSKLLKKAKLIGNVHSFHFPVENADYMESKIVKNLLFETIRIIGVNKIPYLVLHSNHIRPMGKFDHKKLPHIRKRYFDFYKSLGEFAQSQNVIVCIENLPIIGNMGDDFDSVFVFPKDFNNLPKNGIRIVWDLGHWAYTCNIFKTVSKTIKSLPKSTPIFPDFIKLKKNISHFHFSSFKKLNSLMCREGIVPRDGDFNEDELVKCCKIINKWPQEIGMTLEIQEKDYRKRINLIKTIKWFDSKVFIHPSGKARMV